MDPHTFTLAELRAEKPCKPGWERLLSALGNPPMDTRISIGDVAVSNGADDALWCLRMLPDPRARVRAIMPAVTRASKHTDDERVHDCIAAVVRWLEGDDTVDLEAAQWSADRAAGPQAAAWAAAAANSVAALAAAGTQAAAGAAAARAAETADESYDAERHRQRADLIKMFPPLILEPS